MDLKQLHVLFSQIKSIVSEDYIVTALVFLFLVYLVATSFVELGKQAMKIIAALKSAAMTSIEALRGGAQYREHLLRRRQFLTVLSSDLATIGKAEAWNDQNFTDLEAEVQIEGGYFASVFDRVRKRRSYGRRRETSLIGAIDGSAERCLLLTGDPGAGKSVALRHLAVQMIERARTSKRRYEPVPLYINLRELEIDGEVGPAEIRSFVIDNVRRGDADTAEYLNRNWSDFHKNGGWFFLFDSFDEIPKVLHAANEDAQIEKYGKAIQQFMDGLGDCRGVLASREFKSPKGLVWPRLKILPLNEGLQEELVKNTFLTKQQKQVVLRVMSTSKSVTYRNPLFLTLLCRHVREYETPPKNEHDLLYRHVNSLCERDEEFVMSRWGLTTEMMRTGSAELSKVFAMAPELGLAPSIDEISKAAQNSAFLKERVEQVIEALTYVKVGRMDVAASSRKERRFAFAHRRYHEAIFARYLSENQGAIVSSELLCDLRWREYVVAMLQTTSLDNGHQLIDAAAVLIADRCAAVKLHEEKLSGVTIRTFDWEDEVITHLLKLMVDVKAFNPSSSWAETERAVENFFIPLWRKGDLFDRMMIIRYGGAGSSEAHSARMDYARKSGISSLQEEAVSSCQFATTPSKEVANWIRERVARRVVTSKSNIDALRWEALSSQLPAAYEVAVCVDRAKAMRAQHRYQRFLMVPLYYLDRLMPSPFRRRHGEPLSYQRFRSAMLSVNMFPVFALAGAAFAAEKISVPQVVKFAVSLLVLACVLNLAVTHVRLDNLSMPRKLRVSDAWRSVTMDYRMLLTATLAAVVGVSCFLLPGLVLMWSVRQMNLLTEWKYFEIIVAGTLAFWMVVFVVILIMNRRSDSLSASRASAALTARKSLRSAVARAMQVGNVVDVCRVAVEHSQTPTADLRRTVTLISDRLMRKELGYAERLDLAGGASVLLLECESRHASCSPSRS